MNDQDRPKWFEDWLVTEYQPKLQRIAALEARISVLEARQRNAAARIAKDTLEIVPLENGQLPDIKCPPSTVLELLALWPEDVCSKLLRAYDPQWQPEGKIARLTELRASLALKLGVTPHQIVEVRILK